MMAAATASAQSPDSVALPTVVITATRVPAPLGAGLVSTTVISREMLDRSGVRDVADALRLVPGVAIARSGGAGAQASLFLRGGENDYVRVLVDGVPVNDPGGAVDLGWLSLDEVDRIEVVRGPTSVLYGTDAVNGVVQLFTRRPGGARIEASTSAGRYGAITGDGAVSFGTRANGIRIGASREQTDGILDLNNQYERTALSIRANASPRAGTNASLTLRGLDDEFHFPTDGAGGYDDTNAFRKGRRAILSAAVDHIFSDRLRGEASFSAMNSRGIDDDRPDSPSDDSHYDALTTIRRRVTDARAHLMLSPTSVLTLGADLSLEGLRGNDSSNFSFERSQFTASRRTRAAFVQWLAESGPVSFTVGARFDDDDVYGSFQTGRAAVAVRAWEGARVRANLATAFKSPTFYETFNTAFSTGNPDLVPERSRSWEVGLTQVMASGRVTVEATWFHQRFRDMIQYGFIDVDLPNYFNVAAALARGLEVELDAKPTDRLRVGLAGTFLTTRVEDAGLQSGEAATFVEGKRLLRRPSSVVTATLGFDLSRASTVDVMVRRTGSRDDRDFATFPATPVTLPAYTMVDLAWTGPVFTPRVGTDLAILLRVDNALDADYQEVASYPTARRSLTVGLRAVVR